MHALNRFAAITLFAAMSMSMLPFKDRVHASQQSIILKPGETVRVVHKLEYLPQRWRQAIEQSQTCSVSNDWLKHFPIKIVRARDSLLVFVPCPAPVARTQLFQKSPSGRLLNKLAFAVPARPRGFKTDDVLGGVEWREDEGSLTSTYCTDVGPACTSRSTYFFPEFTLRKLEHSRDRGKTWQTYWNAPEWKKPE